MGETEFRSPRIERLARDLAAGDARAVEAFWREIETAGAPLVETIDGDADRALVTFVYRGDDSANGVAAIGWIAGGAGLQSLTRLHVSDVWYHTVVAPRAIRTAYRFLPNPPAADVYGISSDEWAALQREGRFIADPLNSARFQCGSMSPLDSVLELPGADPQPWIGERDVPRGKLEPHRFESATLGGARIVWTYEPPGYDASGAPYPLLVLHDGYSYANMDLQHTLDNLIAAGKIPPVVCALYQWADRMLELSCNEMVADALADDLVRAWLSKRLHVTDEPSRTIIGGLSLGGLAATFAAVRRPDAFGNVMSQSGSFWWGPGATSPADMTQEGVAWEWLTAQVRERSLPPMRCFVEVGVLESSPAGSRMPDMIEPNRRMRDALVAAGHQVQYREFNGGHDFVCWRGNIADALIAIAGPWVRS
jgi:enterochelin esterase family protein